MLHDSECCKKRIVFAALGLGVQVCLWLASKCSSNTAAASATYCVIVAFCTYGDCALLTSERQGCSMLDGEVQGW